MGVPGLWPFVSKRFPRCVKRVRKGRRAGGYDYVHLDANGLLHGAAQEAFNYGEARKPVDPYYGTTTEERKLLAFEMFFSQVLEVLKMVVPRKGVYFAIDGPAPRAKQKQQRERRFVAARDRIPGSFDSNSITPGTVFMHELTQFLFLKIREELKGSWKGLEVVFSPPTVPGEGEHKIMDHIRAFPEGSHCMFGPDGDLLVLALTSPAEKMALFRRDQYDPELFFLVDSTRMKEGLPKVLHQEEGVSRGVRSLEDVANDFALLGFLSGNDFVPKFKAFYRLQDGLSVAFDAYGSTSIGGTAHHVTKGGRVSVQGLGRLVDHLAQEEPALLLAQVSRKPQDKRFVDRTLLASASGGHLDFEKFRRNFYAKAGIAEVEAKCEEYLKNLAWTLEYYVRGIPSWSLVYGGGYAPLVADFASLLGERGEEVSPWDDSGPMRPFEQLVSVLPPASFDLLPFHVEPSPLFPVAFEVDLEGKRKEFEGVVHIPEVPRREAERICSTESRKYHKNALGTDVVLWWDDKAKPKTFVSKFGTLEGSKVVKGDPKDRRPTAQLQAPT